MTELQSLRGALVRRLIRRGTRPHDAEDIAHDAFVRLWVAQKKEHIRNSAAFLTDVVDKVRIECWGVAQRSRRLVANEPVEESDIIDSSPRPEGRLQVEQRLHRFSQYLRALSPRARDVFFLHRLEGLTCPNNAPVFEFP